MAWTAPKTYAGNSAATSADRNTYERDNLNWLANDRPRAGAVRSASLSVPDGASTAVTLPQTDEFDVGPMHDPASNSERLTIPTGGNGLYLLEGMISWTANSVGRRILVLYRNGSQVTGIGDTRAPDTGGSTLQSFSVLMQLVAGDFVEMQATQSSGGALNLTNARFQACWMTF